MFDHMNTDADILQRDLERKGNISYNLRKEGICTHGWFQSETPTNGIKGVVCLHCNKTWENQDSFWKEYDELQQTYF
jgi:hypothetical protein